MTEYCGVIACDDQATADVVESKMESRYLAAILRALQSKFANLKDTIQVGLEPIKDGLGWIVRMIGLPPDQVGYIAGHIRDWTDCIFMIGVREETAGAST